MRFQFHKAPKYWLKVLTYQMTHLPLTELNSSMKLPEINSLSLNSLWYYIVRITYLLYATLNFENLLTQSLKLYFKSTEDREFVLNSSLSPTTVLSYKMFNENISWINKYIKIIMKMSCHFNLWMVQSILPESGVIWYTSQW